MDIYTYTCAGGRTPAGGWACGLPLASWDRSGDRCCPQYLVLNEFQYIVLSLSQDLPWNSNSLKGNCGPLDLRSNRWDFWGVYLLLRSLTRRRRETPHLGGWRWKNV